MMFWSRKQHDAPRDGQAQAALARADHALVTAQAVSDEVRKVTASMTERVERNHLTESIDAVFVTRREGRPA